MIERALSQTRLVDVEMLTIEFLTDVGCVVNVLPPPLKSETHGA